MKTFSFYRLANGFFTGRTYSGPEDMLGINTLPGCGAVEGEHDPQAVQVDVTVDPVQVVPRVDAPAGDDMTEWTWSVITERWEPQPTLKAIKLQAREAIKAKRTAVAFADITVDGRTYDADATSVDYVSKAVQGMQLSGATTREWTLADNTTAELTLDQLKAVGIAMDAQVNGAWETARPLLAAIEAAETAEQVWAVAWPSAQ